MGKKEVLNFILEDISREILAMRKIQNQMNDVLILRQSKIFENSKEWKRELDLQWREIAMVFTSPYGVVGRCGIIEDKVDNLQKEMREGFRELYEMLEMQLQLSKEILSKLRE